MNFFTCLNQMLVILFAVVTGYVSKKLGFLDDEMDGKLSRFMLYVLTPCMMLASIINREEMPPRSVVLTALGISMIFFAVELVLVLAVPPILGGTKGEKGVWRFTMALPNMGFIGLPVVMGFFGEDALFYTVVMGIPFGVISFALGPVLLGGSIRGKWKQILTPGLISSLIVLVIALCQLRLPRLAGEMLQMVGETVIPVSLMLVGSLLARMPVREMLGGVRVWIVMALRLLALPAMLAWVLSWMNLDPLLYGVAVVLMATPVGVNGILMCITYDGDARTMAQSTFLTTLLSTVTIPLVAAFLL